MARRWWRRQSVDGAGGEDAPETVRGLNRAQQTAVTVTLRQLERALQRITPLLESTQEDTLSRTVTPLTPDRRQEARQLVSALRQEIAATARAFALVPEVSDGRRVIVGQLAIAWESLEDARSAKLRAYGGVDPGLEATLDPHIARLIALLLALERLVEGDTAGSQDSLSTGLTRSVRKVHPQ